MQSEWILTTLDDVCTKITDGAHNSPKSVDIGMPMASVKDLTFFGVDLSKARLISIEEYDKLVKQGCRPEVKDVLIAKDGNSALDTVCVINEPLDAVMLSSVAILRPDPKKLDSHYLKYYFCSKSIISYLKRNFISGAAIPRVVLRDFKKAEIRLPSLEIQRKISSILRSLDDKIELNHKMNQTLEEMAQALFKSWFVDFDPVHAKAGAKSDAELDAVAAELGIAKEVLELFPSEFVESEMRMIPKGWSWKLFGEILTPKKGKVITKKTITPGNVPVVAGGLSPAYYHNIYNAEAPVITVSASGANAGFVNLYTQNIWASDCSYINNEMTKYVYLTYLFLSLKQDEITRMQQGAAQPHVYPKDLMRLIIANPDMNLWNYLEKLIEPMFKQIENNEKESKTLQQTRDTLLPKLLSGELDVSEVKI